MLDLSKFSKKWIPKIKKYLLRVEDPDMIIYALISKDCKKKEVIKVINRPNCDTKCNNCDKNGGNCDKK